MVSRMPKRGAMALIAAACAGFAAMPGAAYATCDGLSPPSGVPARPARPVTAGDLLGLRDIGQPDGSMFGEPSPLGISPDGRWAAFILNRAEPATNSYCRALVVIDLAHPAVSRVIDRGGELVTEKTLARGLVVDVGFPAIVTPVWSPDGRWIAYLRCDHGLTQVWRARIDASAGEQVTHAPVDVEVFAWSADSARLVYVAQPGQITERATIGHESLTGWRYDNRFAPNYGMHPLVPDTPREAVSVAPDGSDPRPATSSEQALVAMSDPASAPSTLWAAARDGRRAVTEPRDADPLGSMRLVVLGRDGERAVCTAAACDGGFTGLWWDANGRDLLFLRREGWANGEMGLYRWTPGEGTTPHRVLQTGDVLLGCVMVSEGLLCTGENATRPRHLVIIDPATGAMHTVYDPNPEFRNIALGTVERLRWTNNLGLPAWGDLVLPPGIKPHSKLPMVVVQYHSDGFLRGGTGDEYPIYAFAARGIAVLSVERTPFVAQGKPGVHSYADVNAINMKDWAERRSLLSSVETGVKLVIARGIADPARIGITGLSDGSSTARFALINSDMFAAAAISTCCIEPQSTGIYGGPAYAEATVAMGFPLGGRDDPDFWRPYSMALNANKMNRPLLMQLADEETLLGLQTYTALRNAGQPVEIYVFPDEHHIKWQPAHRAAIYERNLDWFGFWLQGKEDADPAKAGQYRDWEAMRAHLKG